MTGLDEQIASVEARRRDWIIDRSSVQALTDDATAWIARMSTQYQLEADGPLQHETFYIYVRYGAITPIELPLVERLSTYLHGQFPEQEKEHS